MTARHTFANDRAVATAFLWLALAFVLGACSGAPPGGGPPGRGPTATPILLKFDDPVVAPQPAAPVIAATSEPTPASASEPTMTPAPAAVRATPAPQPERLMALGQRLSVALRAAPGGAVVRSVPGSTVLWAQAISADRRWLQVIYDDAGSTAWVARGDVQLFGDPAQLAPPLISAADPTPPASGAAEGTVLADTLNVRAGPGQDQPIVGKLRAGDRVEIIRRSADDGWLEIAQPDGSAWVAARFVSQGTQTPAPQTPAPTAPAGAPRPQVATGLSGKIALKTGSGGDIYLMNADGSDLQRFTDGIDPALSPDGTRLAYARWGAPHAIFVRDLTTGQEQQVVSANRPRGPTWSADGQRLAFSYSTRSFTCRASPFGCIEEEQLREMFGGECMRTPFGEICIADLPVQVVDDYALVSINPDGSGWQDVPAQKKVSSPGWRATGDEILYHGDKGLQITAPAGDTRPLVDDPQISSPAWSPDGQRIAVQQWLHDHADIFILDAAGNVVQRITAPASAIGKAPNNVAPAWSPDGQHLLFLSDRDGAWKLYRSRVDGSEQQPMAPQALSDLQFSYDFAAERVVSWSR